MSGLPRHGSGATGIHTRKQQRVLFSSTTTFVTLPLPSAVKRPVLAIGPFAKNVKLPSGEVTLKAVFCCAKASPIYTGRRDPRLVRREHIRCFTPGFTDSVSDAVSSN